ncbi:MAG: hypothetical protein BWY19_00317 [bacterium ADurb.Bin212]|nr:MAG: hypothetical protein BWY19_00317 [bacterium ADurb.Bin212]
MPLPTWDVFIIIAFILSVAYGFILRREKTITVLCSTYIGIVIASNFSNYLYELFNGDKFIAGQVWIKSDASLPTISIALLLISSFFISGAINSTSNKAGDISPFEIFLYSTLNMALIIATILNFLPEETRIMANNSSKIANIIYSYHTVWVIAPPILLIFLNFRKK